MQGTVRTVYDCLDAIAPFDTQESWDNAGLLAGRMDAPVDRVLVALDLTEAVVAEAVACGASLIVTHHPILFHARKQMREDDPEGARVCALIRAHIALIAVHTNFDLAPGGVNDALAAALGFTDVVQVDETMLRVGHFGGTLRELADAARRALGGVQRIFGDGDAHIECAAVCGGAGGSFWQAALHAGADALLTGEVRYSDALDAAACGLNLIEAGHDRTERASVKALRNGLQARLHALQCKIAVLESAVRVFPD